MSAPIYAPVERIWQRVLRRVEVNSDGCWIWTGTVNSRGYGCIGSGKRSRTVLVHRIAVMFRDGAIPDGMTVDHRCHHSDTCRLDADCRHRRCVNPEHLAVVTLAANVARTWESGRCRQGHLLREKKRKDRIARYCPECARPPKNNSVTSSDYWRRRREDRSQGATDGIDVRAFLDGLFPSA